MPTPAKKALTTAATTPAPEQEEQLFDVTIIIHTSSREDFKLTVGRGNAKTVQDINATIDGALLSTKTSNNFRLTDQNGVGYHFNTDHIVCAEVRLG